MNIKHTLVLSIFLSSLSYALPKDIIIRNAKKTDLLALCKLNRAVEFEYFKPLYKKGYAHLPIGKNPDSYLEKELQANKKWFLQSIQKKNDINLYVAHDTKKNNLAGMIAVHKEDTITLEIDLLLVQKKYRNLGIGHALINYTLKQFPYISSCIVFPLKHANKKTLKFYESVGFKNYAIPKSYQQPIKEHNTTYDDTYLFYKREINED